MLYPLSYGRVWFFPCFSAILACLFLLLSPNIDFDTCSDTRFGLPGVRLTSARRCQQPVTLRTSGPVSKCCKEHHYGQVYQEAQV